MKAGVYYRVSTKDKQDIGMQKQAVRGFCDRENLEIFKEYSDIGISGSKDTRPGFDDLLEDMRNKKFDCVVVYELTRIGRSLSHLVKLFEEFKKKNIKFISVSQPLFDTTKEEGELFLHIMMSLADYERKLTIRRINSGLERAKASGKRLGRPKGSKDKKKRTKSGYYLRWSKKTTL